MINPGIKDLLHYYSMEGASSSNEVDRISGVTLNQYGGSASTGGKIGNGREIELSSSEYFLSASKPLIPAGSFTVGFWWYAETVTTTRQVLMNFAASEAWRLRLEAKRVELSVHNGTAYTTITWGSDLTASAWHHIHFWVDVDGDKQWLSVDGGLPIYTAFTGTPSAPTGGLYIGQSANGTYFADGIIDELYMYKRAISMDWFYNAGNGRSYYDLWKGAVIIL